MEILQWYLLFAVATGLTALYELYNPVLQRIEQFHPDSPLAQNKTLGYLTAFASFVLLAPAVFVVCIVPAFGETFRESMYVGSTSED